jgi:hypothetical protein
MKAFALGLVTLAALASAGCEDEPLPGQASKRVPTPVAEVRGKWQMDVSAFVSENLTVLEQTARRGVESLRKERERIATLRIAERIQAERALQAKIDALPSDRRAAVEAALGSQEDFREWLRTTVATRMASSSLALEFHAGGRCTFVLALAGKETLDAEGTWSQQGNRITVKLTTTNGKPAKGKDLQPVTMTVRGDRLQFVAGAGGPKIVARRV